MHVYVYAYAYIPIYTFVSVRHGEPVIRPIIHPTRRHEDTWYMSSDWCSGLSQHHRHLDFKQLYIFRLIFGRRKRSAIRYVIGTSVGSMREKINTSWGETRRRHCLVEAARRWLIHCSEFALSRWRRARYIYTTGEWKCLEWKVWKLSLFPIENTLWIARGSCTDRFRVSTWRDIVEKTKRWQFFSKKNLADTSEQFFINQEAWTSDTNLEVTITSECENHTARTSPREYRLFRLSIPAATRARCIAEVPR